MPFSLSCLVAMPPVLHPSPSTKENEREALVRDPVYQQLNELLQGLIRSGEFKPGEQFLTEREVGRRFGVSRVTANKALSHLVVEGVLEFRRGVGSFVREGFLHCDLQSLVSFTQKARAAGMTPSTRVLSFKRILGSQLNSEDRQRLEVLASDGVWSVERLRLADGCPVILERRLIVASRCPSLTREQLQNSLYELFERSSATRPTGSRQSIRAINLPKHDAKLLRVPVGTAALWVHALGLAGSPLWLEDTFYRADRYEFLNHLGSDQPNRPANPRWRTDSGHLKKTG